MTIILRISYTNTENSFVFDNEKKNNETASLFCAPQFRHNFKIFKNNSISAIHWITSATPMIDYFKLNPNKTRFGSGIRPPFLYGIEAFRKMILFGKMSFGFIHGRYASRPIWRLREFTPIWLKREKNVSFYLFSWFALYHNVSKYHRYPWYPISFEN